MYFSEINAKKKATKTVDKNKTINKIFLLIDACLDAIPEKFNNTKCKIYIE